MGLPRACVQARRAAAGRRTTLQAGCGEPGQPKCFQKGIDNTPVGSPRESVSHVLFDGHFGKKRVLLKHESHAPMLRRDVGTRRRVEQNPFSESDRPSSGSVRPAIMRSRVVFPAPEGPNRAMHSAPSASCENQD